jgi:hypothetical protein
MSGYSGSTTPAWERYSDSSSTPTWRDFPSAYSKEEKKTFDPGSFSRPKRDVDWEGLSRVTSSLFDKAKDTDKYRDYASRSGPTFGDWSRGGGGQVLENLGVVYPQQQGPMYIPGVEGSKSGLGSAIGTLAGIGASFIPGLGPGIKAAMPAIGGSIGSFF